MSHRLPVAQAGRTAIPSCALRILCTNGASTPGPAYVVSIGIRGVCYFAVGNVNPPGGVSGTIYFDDVSASRDVNNFNSEALDGNHGTMRSQYLQAITDLLDHIKNQTANGAEEKTVLVMDLQNEAYAQMRKYFRAGTSDTSTLGKWSGPENANGVTDCDTLNNSDCTGCYDTTAREVDRVCVDVNITYPWVQAMLTAAKNADSNILYTVSDGYGDLLNGGSLAAQFYAGANVYDIHAYTDSGCYGYPSSSPTSYTGRPWENDQCTISGVVQTYNYPKEYQAGLNFSVPWFVGEAGCQLSVSASNQCYTYHGSDAVTQQAARWWFDNLRNDGATAVLTEDLGTMFDPVTGGAAVTGPMSELTTGVAQIVAAANGDAFAQDFDSNSGSGTGITGTAPGIVGSGRNEFTSCSDSSGSCPDLVLSGTTDDSPQDGLSVCLCSSTGTAYLTKTYAGGPYAVEDLSFAVQLGSDFANSGTAPTLARTMPASGTAGEVEITLSSTRVLCLDYYDSSGTKQSAQCTYILPISTTWHTIHLEESLGAADGDGSLVLSETDPGGQPTYVSRSLDLKLGTPATTGVAKLELGDVSAGTPADVSGHLYLDEVEARSPASLPADPGMYSGWCLVGIPTQVYANENDLANDIRLQGGSSGATVVEEAIYSGGTQITSTCTTTTSPPITTTCSPNNSLQPGAGVFLELTGGSSPAFSWTPAGVRMPGPVSVAIAGGENQYVSMAFPDYEWASTACYQLDQTPVTGSGYIGCSFMTYFPNGGRWVDYVPGYSADFSLNPSWGVDTNATNAGSWVPQ